MFEGSNLEDQFFAFFTRKYVQRADVRQRALGLVYTEAETHDLAKETARFVQNARAEITDEAVVRAAKAMWKASVPPAQENDFPEHPCIARSLYMKAAYAALNAALNP